MRRRSVRVTHVHAWDFTPRYCGLCDAAARAAIEIDSSVRLFDFRKLCPLCRAALRACVEAFADAVAREKEGIELQ